MTKKKRNRSQRNQKRIVVTTGGSGGHIFPAESITGALLKKGFDVVFITDKRGHAFQGLEQVKTYRLIADKVMGGSLFHKLIAAVKLYCGAVQALFLIRRLKPALVIGVGGYASIPAVIAAHLYHIPVVLHEQNSVLGRANRVLGPNSRMIVTSFEPTKRLPENVATVWVGMPVRPLVLSYQNRPYPKDCSVFHLVIFGGSQGARFFSTRLPEALLLLSPQIRKKLFITQQVRPENKEATEAIYKTAGFGKYVLSSFFDNMPELISQAHLVIGRGGASTLTELMTIGRPGIIVPLPTSADNHQMENARLFCDSGAGWLVTESAFDPAQFAVRLEQLIQDPELLREAAVQAKGMAKPEAAERVADLVCDLVKGS